MTFDNHKIKSQTSQNEIVSLSSIMKKSLFWSQEIFLKSVREYQGKLFSKKSGYPQREPFWTPQLQNFFQMNILGISSGGDGKIDKMDGKMDREN